MQDEQEAAAAFIDSVLRPERDAAAVLSFTGITRLDQPPTRDAAPRSPPPSTRSRSSHCSDEPRVPATTTTIPQEHKLRCLTGVWDAVVLTVERGALARRPRATRRAIILLSDGDDTSSTRASIRPSSYAVQHNTVIYAIGIRDEDFQLRRDCARTTCATSPKRTGGRAFFPKNRRRTRRRLRADQRRSCARNTSSPTRPRTAAATAPSAASSRNHQPRSSAKRSSASSTARATTRRSERWTRRSDQRSA